MTKISSFFKHNSNAIVISMCVAMLFTISCVTSFAATEDLTSAFSSALSTIQSDILAFIGLALPTGLAIFGTIIAIKKGIGFVKSLLGKAS